MCVCSFLYLFFFYLYIFCSGVVKLSNRSSMVFAEKRALLIEGNAVSYDSFDLCRSRNSRLVSTFRFSAEAPRLPQRTKTHGCIAKNNWWCPSESIIERCLLSWSLLFPLLGFYLSKDKPMWACSPTQRLIWWRSGPRNSCTRSTLCFTTGEFCSIVFFSAFFFFFNYLLKFQERTTG